MITACRSKLPALAALCLVAAIAQSAYAQGKDELWEMTTKMEMEGMPMAMPAQTNKVCVEAGRSESAVPAGDSDCRMSSVKSSGSKTTFRMECTQPEKMTGTGEITRTKDSMSGTISLKGDDMNMKQTFSGRRVGSCDAKTYRRQQLARQVPPMGMQPQGQPAPEVPSIHAQRRQNCVAAVDKLDPTPIFQDTSFMDQGMSAQEKAEIRAMISCDEYKAPFCAKARELGKSMRTSKGYASASAKHAKAKEALRACGEDDKAILAAACQNAVSTRDWPFAGKHCPAETEAFLASQEAKDIAAKHCVGRDYSEVLENAGEYGFVCARLARQRGTAAAPAQPKPSGASGAQDAIKEGTNALRKFLKF